MRSWLTGVALGILPLGALVRLPPTYQITCLALASLWLAVAGEREWTRWASGLLCGAVVGLLYGYGLESSRLPMGCEGETLLVRGQVDSLPRVTRMPSGQSRQRFELHVDSIVPPRCRGPRRLLLSMYDGQPMTPGERWALPVRLQRPWGLANPGSFNMQAWYASSGIDAVGRVTATVPVLLVTARGLDGLHHRLRQRVSLRLAEAGLSLQTTAILRAITVGDRSGLDHPLWTLLQHYGINHLVVISGLHVGMVAGLGFWLGGLLDRLRWLAGRARRRSWTAPCSALLFGLAYAALAGFSLSTQRALFMLLCFLAAVGSGRSSGGWNALRWSLLLVLLVNPLAPLGSGFWLSFSAVACLLWYAGWRRQSTRIGLAVGTHLFMGVAVLPMAAWWFGGASLATVAANLLLIPLVTFYLVPVALLGVLFTLLHIPADLFLWRLAALPIEGLLPIAGSFAQGAGRLLYTDLSASPLTLLLALFAAALLALRGGAALNSTAIVLLLPLLLPARGSHSATAGLQLTVLDVGQGTAVVIRSGRRTLVYDTGGGDPAGSNLASTVVLPYLRHVGAGALDTLLLSHPDADHSAGAGSILRAMPVKRVLYSGGDQPTADASLCRAGAAWRWPSGAVFRLLGPANEPMLDSNNSSCVLQVSYGGFRLLLPGDIEADRERALQRYWQADVLNSHWLLAAHHGSQTSSAPSWLKAVDPDTVVFSRGYQNRFGHPHPAVVQRFADGGVQQWDTAVAGALVFDIEPGSITVTAHRDQIQRFWK